MFLRGRLKGEAGVVGGGGVVGGWRLFEVGANSKAGAKSNEYGNNYNNFFGG